MRRLALAGAALLVAAAPLAWRATHRPPAPAKFQTATVTIGDVVEKVQATGTVQPLLQVNVGAQVNGRVTRVLVDFNSVVKKGDVLAEIDPQIYGTQVSAQAANLASQRAQLDQARATTESMKAQVETARIALERTQKLFEANLASHADLDAARGSYLSFKAQFDAAVANVGSQQAAIASQTAQLSQSTHQPRVHEDLLAGRRPGGDPRHRPRRHGRRVVPGAGPLRHRPGSAKDARARRRRRGRRGQDCEDAMDADCVVDAFPGEIFRGTVSQIRFSPNNVSGVVTYPAIVEVANPDEKLRPGMTATITVHTHEARGVPRVPNAALRYHPSPPTTPEGKPIPQAPEPPLAKGQGRVWLLSNDKLGAEKDEQRVISIGITDGMFTVVTDPSLAVGAKVVTDENETEDSKKRRKVL